MSEHLISSTGLSARIHRLPGREPFMLAADLAEAYGTSTKRIVEQVKRNSRRFPAHHAFFLTEEETANLRSQNATTKSISVAKCDRNLITQNVLSNMDRALPMAFTRAGFSGLSAVIKTPIADEVHVIVHDAFAAMEQRAFEQLHATIAKLRCDVLNKKPIYARVVTAASEGWSFEQTWRRFSDPRHRLEQAVRECIGLGLIAAPLAGMTPDLFAGS